MTFDILVACTSVGGIGLDGKIPWYLPPDLKYFQKITTETKDPMKSNAVIMGRNTWTSLPKRPLKGRRNIVLTSTKDVEGIIAQGGEVYRSLDDALSYLKNDPVIENIFVIGGEMLYNVAIAHHKCRHVYITKIDNEYNCDKYFPIDSLERECDSMYNYSDFIMVRNVSGMEHNKIRFSYIKYTSKNNPN